MLPLLIMVLFLNNPESLSSEYLRQLATFRRLFLSHIFFEDLVKDPTFHRLVVKIDGFCNQNRVIGFHYTRGFPEEFLRQGLRVRSGKEARSDFMRLFGDRFTAKERQLIRSRWGQYFTADQSDVRDGRVWFNFTTEALTNGGVERLLSFYGSEQVYMPICSLPGIGEKLRSIGQPLIIQCELIPSELRAFKDYPWGSIVASSYHRILNAEALQTDQDGSQRVPVPPDRIVKIMRYAKS